MLVSRIRPSFGIVEVELLPVAVGTSDWPLLRSLGIGVEDPVGVQAYEHLSLIAFELLLELYRIVSGVEDEQGSG